MTQTTGNFIAYLNRDLEPGVKKPAFDGRISIPGRDEEMRFALWAHAYRNPSTGETQVMFSGKASNVVTNAAPLEQMTTLVKASPENTKATIGNLTLAPRQVVLFLNRFKADAPEKDRPDYWGAFNPGNGEPVVRISAWARRDRNDHAMLTGATSYPLPGKSETQQQDAAIDSLIATGAVSKGMPKTKAKPVSGRS